MGKYAVQKAPWMKYAEQELGVKEFPGDADNPRIIEYHSTTTYGATDDAVPWCSSFVNWCLEKANVQGTNNVGARSWLHWGQPIAQPIPGCVAVLWRETPESYKGHVSFYVGDHPTNQGYLMLLGGNQGDSVCVAAYKNNRILGFRWPIAGNS